MIPFVAAPGGGAIGMSQCPGAPAFDPDALNRDIEAFRQAGATALVSLITARENVARAPWEIGEATERAGLEWHWLPIPDMQIPDAEFERKWAVSGPILRRRLRRGERIVVHCKAAFGRSGTVAARLLVEIGMEASAAIQLIRTASPRAIATPSQERFVAGCTPVLTEDGIATTEAAPHDLDGSTTSIKESPS